MSRVEDNADRIASEMASRADLSELCDALCVTESMDIVAEIRKIPSVHKVLIDYFIDDARAEAEQIEADYQRERYGVM